MITRKNAFFQYGAKAFVLCGVALAGFVFLNSSATNAQAPSASFSLYPNVVSVDDDSFVSVGVFLTSSNEAINGVSGVVHFPSNLVDAMSIDTSDSIIKLWVTQPKISNEDGTITFGGVAFNPGFKGSLGRVLTIRFHAKAFGSAELSISSLKAFVNDGLGTQISASLASPAHINIGSASSANILGGVDSSQGTSQALDKNPGSTSALFQILGILLLIFLVAVGAHNGYSIRKISRRMTGKPVSEEDKKLIKKLKKDIDQVESVIEQESNDGM
jgi:hypothetical protein